MSTIDCDRLDDFYDGLLDDEERAAFKLHLKECGTCQDNLHDRMQLSMRMRSLRGLKPHKTRPRWLVVGAPALMAMAATFVLWPRVDVVAQLGQEQSALPDDYRFSNPAFDHPQQQTKGVMLGPRPELHRTAAHFANLAELSKRGDHHALGVAHLRDNTLDQAAAELQQAVASPAVTNDLAVLALVRGDTATAVALIDRLVEQSPDLTPALWNRGLLLKSMQLDAAAADAFTRVAERGEPVWSDLARVRAKQLKDGAEARAMPWCSRASHRRRCRWRVTRGPCATSSIGRCAPRRRPSVPPR